MPDNTIDTVNTTAHNEILSTRAQLIEALYELGARASIARQHAEDTTAVPEDARVLATNILTALDARVLADPGERGRARQIVGDVLNGGDAALVAERVLFGELFDTWAARTDDVGWHQSPEGSFPDDPTLWRPRIDADPELALNHRNAVASAFIALDSHIAAGPDAMLTEGLWERRFLVLVKRLAATLRYPRPSVGLSAGEHARAHWVFAVLATGDLVGTKREHPWRAVTDPEFFAICHDQRTARAQDPRHHRYLAQMTALDKARRTPIVLRPMIAEHGREFTDCPGVEAVRVDRIDPGEPLLDRAGLEAAVGELLVDAHTQESVYGGADHGWRADVHESATPILRSARSPERGGLSMAEWLRLERVVALIAEADSVALMHDQKQAWQAIIDDSAYDQLLDSRNIVELALQRIDANGEAAAGDPSGQIRGAKTESTATAHRPGASPVDGGLAAATTCGITPPATASGLAAPAPTAVESPADEATGMGM
ncbi:hypothetical protein [Nocardia sp. XZ_19_369]|uniref:hypothetical protein n=1 Tax=Nocardia sp. XZ_19_369 TaxID=2769487 RepID=UPI0018906DCD|nr:hypothetical protein [Nocardia sp. XZ_19_369]